MPARHHPNSVKFRKDFADTLRGFRKYGYRQTARDWLSRHRELFVTMDKYEFLVDRCEDEYGWPRRERAEPERIM